MENSSAMLLLAFSFIAHQFLIAYAHAKHPLVPAVYVFGDSNVDSGNNNHLNTIANANRWPYGIDFNNITGRHTNGKNTADFTGLFLGLPMPPPYLNLSDYERSQITTGINYASGACGILSTSRVGECLSLLKQIQYFTLTATKDLPKAIPDQKKLQQHLAESIYLMYVGVNDYSNVSNNHIMDDFDTPEDFADYLLDEMAKHIKTLYNLGARKFVVFGISKCKPFNHTQTCESRYYDDKLPGRLQDLQAKLVRSLFTIYDKYIVYKKILDNHEKYGITNVNEPCYMEGMPICPDRSKYHLFDRFKHLTEVSHEIATKECFYGKGCYPYTLLDLAKAPIKHHQ